MHVYISYIYIYIYTHIHLLDIYIYICIYTHTRVVCRGGLVQDLILLVEDPLVRLQAHEADDFLGPGRDRRLISFSVNSVWKRLEVQTAYSVQCGYKCVTSILTYLNDHAYAITYQLS